MNSHLLQCAVLLAILAAATVAWPAAALTFARRIGHFAALLARKKVFCWTGLGAMVLILRAALLPIWPVPKPVIYDEFSYLLQADTFAHGRLTTPTHAMWPFFESIYILQKPSYASRYPPGQALMMSVGERAFGNAWFGVWLSAGILAAALCWALQGWLPPRWALLGGAMSVQLCFFSYWMNSYWGGAVTATGGALALGAYGRIARGERQYAWALGAGAVVLMMTRPYEGLLLLVPILFVLARRDRSISVWGPLVLLGTAGAAWLGYYNFRVTGHVLRLPYQEYFAQYETVPPFNILPLGATRTTRHFNLEWLDKGYATELYRKSRSLLLLSSRPAEWSRALQMMLGETVFAVPLILLAPIMRGSRRTRFPVILGAVMLAGSLIEVTFFPHYGAPFTAVVLVLAVASLRYLQLWKPGGRRVGLFLARALPLGAFAVMIGNDALLIARHKTPDRVQAVNSQRDTVAATLLDGHPGQHVIFVRYTGTQSPHEEWIYNPADIDAAPVIWAQDMGEAENARLVSYYRGRQFWHFLPDEKPLRLTPY